MDGSIMRIGIVIVGLLLIVFSFWTHSKKRLAVNYAVIWALLGLLLVLVGAVPVLSRWTTMVSPEMRLVIFCGGVLILFTEIQSSLTISQLTFKNREMAMHMALLNQESARAMEQVRELQQELEEESGQDAEREQRAGS